MNKKRMLKILTLFIIGIGLVPIVAFAEASDNQSGSGGGTTGGGSGGTKWPNYVGSSGVAGMRMSVVDQWGNLVPGTHTVDFVNVIPTDAAANANSSRMKTGAINGGINWVSLNASGISIETSYVTITWNSSDNLTVNGTSQANYFNSLAKSDELYNNYIVKTGYNRSMQVNYNKHYILVEPTTVVQISGKRYYGTATELALLIGTGYKSTINTVPRKYLARSTCYSGSFMTPGPKNNGQTINAGDQLYAFTGGSLTGSSCNSLSSNADITRKSGNTVNGNGVGIYYAAAMLKEWCDINNPEHFHVVDGSDDQDYKPNDKTALCCEEMAAQYGPEYVEKLYPICGACPVEPDSDPGDCSTGKSVSLKDTSSFDCLYKGVSGSGASKYDYSSRESVRKKYKVGTIGTKYCEVYCTDEITGDFPTDYKGLIAPGSTFVWPSYNSSENDNLPDKTYDYEALVNTKRTCKIRFRQQEWLSDFNNGDANKKQQLVDALKECSSENSLTKYYDKYMESLDPKLELSYNNGKNVIGPKTLKLATNETESNMTCDNCTMDTNSFNVNNVTSLISNIASQIANKTLNITAKLKYVLPDGLYQYVDKKSGTLLENYVPSDDEEGNSDGKLDTGYSKLLVSEEAKVGNKYDLIINYSSLSPVAGKFENESGKYACKYEVTTNSGGLKCDLNEPNHFKDLNGDGKLDSGPNGEDCCEKVADEFGEKSEVYQELVDKGWCPVDPDDDNPGDSCVYPDDLETSDIITKQKCCSMVLTDPSLSIEERVDHYNKYCVGDPYCPQDCEDGVCHYSPMTQDLRNCIASGKSYNECKIDNCPAGGSIVIYRPISLLTDESFPGVEKLDRIWSNNNWYYYSNWAYRGGTSQDRDYYAEKYITNNRGVKEYEIYDMDPMYVIDLDADTIGAIRKYNDTNSYDDFNLTCKNDRQCRSDFVKDYATGCGVNDDWYACKGISASRGD